MKLVLMLFSVVTLSSCANKGMMAPSSSSPRTLLGTWTFNRLENFVFDQKGCAVADIGEGYQSIMLKLVFTENEHQSIATAYTDSNCQEGEVIFDNKSVPARIPSQLFSDVISAGFVALDLQYKNNGIDTWIGHLAFIAADGNSAIVYGDDNLHTAACVPSVSQAIDFSTHLQSIINNEECSTVTNNYISQRLQNPMSNEYDQNFFVMKRIRN